MKRTFHITADKVIEGTDTVLLCELSQHHACISLADATSKSLRQLSYYELKNGLVPVKLSDILKAEKLDPAGNRRIVLNNACKEIILVPAHHFTEESASRFYTSTYGMTSDTLFFDDVKEHNLVVVHAVPQDIMSILKSSHGTEVRHRFSCQLKANNHFRNDNQIAVHFTGCEIFVAAKKEQQLQLVQTYFYSAPLDVVYYLLAICRQYGLSQSGTAVILSGLVSEDSAMLREIHQYFSDLHFWKTNTKNTLPGNYPQHFFSSMYNLAACVL